MRYWYYAGHVYWYWLGDVHRLMIFRAMEK